MSGSTKAAFSASASMRGPKSQTMYWTLTSPMIRDRKVEAMSRTVAVKAVCACEGCSSAAARHRDCGQERTECGMNLPLDSILPGGGRTRDRLAKYPVRMSHCQWKARTFGWGLVLLMAAGTGAAAQAIHGREGFRCLPPAVEAAL